MIASKATSAHALTAAGIPVEIVGLQGLLRLPEVAEVVAELEGTVPFDIDVCTVDAVPLRGTDPVEHYDADQPLVAVPVVGADPASSDPVAHGEDARPESGRRVLSASRGCSAPAGAQCQRRGLRAGLEPLQAEVPVLDLHRRTDVHLHAQQVLQHCGGSGYRGRVAIGELLRARKILVHVDAARAVADGRAVPDRRGRPAAARGVVAARRSTGGAGNLHG